jgi:hypothetical protein
MKFSVWDALTILALLGLFIVGIIVFTIFANPTSGLNPFPPPTQPEAIVLPSQTPTLVAMPSTWTPVSYGSITPPVGEAALSGTPTLTTTLYVVSSGTPTATITPTGTITPIGSITPTPTDTITGTLSPTATLPSWARTNTAVSNIFATATSRVINQTLTAMPTNTPTSMPNLGNATEKKGTKSNVWQKIVNNPTFLFNVTPAMFEYYWYFGRNSDGTDNTDAHRVAIHHDSKTLEFTPPAVTECGAYYLRIQVSYAIKTGKTITYSYSDWKTLFIFKYDDTPPDPPLYAITGISGAIRGIQNISGSPHFNWSGVNGANQAHYILPAGDYIGYDPTGGSNFEPYLCSGIKNYNVYWGPDPEGVSNPKSVSSSSYTPSSVKSNTAYYLRVQSVDNLINKSDWRTVALDPGYDPEAVSFAEPTPDQAVFYYDTVRPNNIGGINETTGYTNNGPFRNERSPSFNWTGGQDPVGFNTGVIWGYEVVWDTNPAATSRFQKVNTYNPLLSTSGTYYLRVRAEDWAGNVSPDWQQFILRYDGVGPVSVTSVKESNGVKSNTYYNSLADAVLHFSWDPSKLIDPGNSTNSSGIQSTLWVYWGTDPAGLPNRAQALSLGTFNSDPVGSTGVYYLRMMTRDNVGNETITNPFVLKFDNDAPTDPVITELGGAQNNIDQNLVKNPNFSWSSTDNGSGIKGFYYCWAKGSTCTPTKWVTSGKYDPSSVSTGVYYLEVKALDNAGNYSGISEFVFRYTP